MILAALAGSACRSIHPSIHPETWTATDPCVGPKENRKPKTENRHKMRLVSNDHHPVMIFFVLALSWICETRGDVNDEAHSNALFERYDWTGDGRVDFGGELTRLLEDRLIIQDLDRRTLETLYLHLRDRYDADRDGAMDGAEFKRLAKDLRGSEVDRNGKRYSISPEDHYKAGLTAYEQTVQGSREDSYEEAYRRFEKAARGGHPAGQHSFGAMHYFGHGCEEDRNAAEKWWRKAAGQGHADSAFNLGQTLRHEEATADEAVTWMRRAAELGSDQATAMLKHHPYNPPPP